MSITDDKRTRISITMATPWFTLWIFTIAFAHLCFYQGVLAVAIWPYYLGGVLARLAGLT